MKINNQKSTFNLYSIVTYGLLGTILFILFSCKDILIDDVKGKKIAVNSPAQGQKITNNSVTFWWNPMIGALNYRLQIVRNRFDSLPIFIADTSTSKTQITLNLKPFNYEWRLWAENGLSRSDTIRQILKVDSASLIEQIIKIRIPANLDTAVGTSPFAIRWGTMLGASKYEVSISRPGAADTSLFTLNTFRAIPFSIGDGTYSVKVRGRRNADFSQWSETVAILYLTSKPEIPNVIAPTNSTPYSNSLEFKFSDVFPKNVIAYNITLTYIPTTGSPVSRSKRVTTNTFTFTDSSFQPPKGSTVEVSITSVSITNINSDPVKLTLTNN